MSRVALIGDNSVEYVNQLLDIWNNGDCAVLLDWRIPLSVAVQMMQEACVNTCYVEKNILDKYSEKFTGEIMFICYEKRNSFARLLPDYIYKKFKPNYSSNEAVILYSSGTTGKAKGIILSHYAINSNSDAIIDYWGLSECDRMYIIKNISHSSSITGELLVALKTRTQILMTPVILPPRCILQNIEKYSITRICINPTMLKMYIDEFQRKKYDLSSLKEIYVHGAKASDDLCNTAQNFFENAVIYYEYGLSEAGPRVTSQKISRINNNSVGKAIKNVKIAIIDDKGNPMPPENVGTIYVDTPSRFLGYVSGKKNYASIYMNWLNTGDVGYIDKDGELHVVDRIDDVIILNAHKIYPSEVEQRILMYTEIIECVVSSFKRNGNTYIGCLYTAKNEITNFKNILMKILMPYEIPGYFLKCDEIPRTENGKISRLQAKKILETVIK